MTTIASQITSLTVVYSTAYSDADERKYQSSASLAFVWGIHRDRWIPRTKGQLRGKCFHLMTSSCPNNIIENLDLITHRKHSHHLTHFNSLFRNDAMWWYRSGSTLTRVMICWLEAPNNHLKQLQLQYPNTCYGLSLELPVKLLSGKCHGAALMISQHWFRWWLGAVRQQAITWANIDPDLCRHMASPSQSDLKHPWEYWSPAWIWRCLFRYLSFVTSFVRITMTSERVRWRLKSPASSLFTQPFIRAQIKENIKAPRQWPLCNVIPRTNGQ